MLVCPGKQEPVLRFRRCPEQNPSRSGSADRGFGHEEDHWHASGRGGAAAHHAHGDRGGGRSRGVRRIASASPRTKFGTLPSPCGKGHATGATDQGVTNTTINIAYGDDRGFSGLPGLDQEMGDAVKAMIAWCNAQGGINGRKIVGDYYDAAVTNVGSVMTQACKKDFMLVGEGFALDGVAEGTRLGCNLAAVPGFTVSPVVANAYEMYQASPNPADYSPVSSAYEATKLFGKSKTQKAGEYNSTLSTQQAVDGQGRAGLHRDRLEVRPTASSRSITTARPTTPRSCRSSRAAASRSSTTTPRRARPSTAPSRRRTRSATTRSGSRTPAPTRPPSPSGTRPGWATTSTSASPTSRSRQPRSFRPSPSTWPS